MLNLLNKKGLSDPLLRTSVLVGHILAVKALWTRPCGRTPAGEPPSSAIYSSIHIAKLEEMQHREVA
jgi:hypothetical protein